MMRWNVPVSGVCENIVEYDEQLLNGRLINPPIQQFLIAFGFQDPVYFSGLAGAWRGLATGILCLMVKPFAFLPDRIFIFFPIAFIAMRAHG